MPPRPSRTTISPVPPSTRNNVGIGRDKMMNNNSNSSNINNNNNNNGNNASNDNLLINRKPQPTHPQEYEPLHCNFLKRSLERCDVELAALNRLHTTLHHVRNVIVKTFGEELLLDLGEGIITLGPDNKTILGLTESADSTTLSSSEEEDSPTEEEKKKRKIDLCRDFLLRMKLRRRLLNRLARRLNRLSHSMDGENVYPPGPPKYGDAPFVVNEEQLDLFKTRQQEIEHAKARIQQRKVAELAAGKLEEARRMQEAMERNQIDEQEHRRKYLSDGDEEQDSDDEGDDDDQDDDKGKKYNKVKQEVTGNKIDDSATKIPTSGFATANVTANEAKQTQEKPPTVVSSASIPTPVAPIPAETTGSSSTTTTATTNASHVIIDGITSNLPSTSAAVAAAAAAATPPTDDYDVLKEYDTHYEKLYYPNTKKVKYTFLLGNASSSTTATSKPNEEDDEPDYANIKYGAGIGATHRTMSAREKAAEYKRWQLDVLGRIPDQPTFDELGMNNRIFNKEKRRRKQQQCEEKKTEKVENRLDDVNGDDEEEEKKKQQDVTKAKKKEKEQVDKKRKKKRKQTKVDVNETEAAKDATTSSSSSDDNDDDDESESESDDNDEQKQKKSNKKNKKNKRIMFSQSKNKAKEQDESDSSSSSGSESDDSDDDDEDTDMFDDSQDEEMGAEDAKIEPRDEDGDVQAEVYYDRKKDYTDGKNKECNIGREGGANGVQKEVTTVKKKTKAEAEGYSQKERTKEDDKMDIDETGSDAKDNDAHKKMKEKSKKDDCEDDDSDDEEMTEAAQGADSKKSAGIDRKGNRTQNGGEDEEESDETDSETESTDSSSSSSNDDNGEEEDEDSVPEDKNSKVKTKEGKALSKEGKKKEESVTKGGEEKDASKDVKTKETMNEKKDKKGEKENKATVSSPPKKIKTFHLTPIPSFADQDLKRIRQIHANLLTSSMHEYARRRIAEVTAEYNRAFRASNEILARRVKLEAELNKMMYQHRLAMNKRKTDHALEVAIARAKWQKKKETWEAQRRAHRLALERVYGAGAMGGGRTQYPTPPTDDRAVVKRTLDGIVDRIVAKTLPKELAVGTPSTTAAALKPNPLLSAVASTLGHVVDAVSARVESGWTDDRSSSPPRPSPPIGAEDDGETFEEFVPPPMSEDVVVNPATGETLTQMHERIENTYRKELAVLLARLQSSEEERTRAWRKMLKTKAEYEAPAQSLSSSSRRARGQLDVTNMQLLPVPPLRPPGSGGMPPSSAAAVAQTTVPAYVPPPIPAVVVASTPAPPPAPAAPKKKSPAPAPASVSAVTGGGSGGGTTSSGRPVSESKYSAAKVKERIFADGSVMPVTMPKKTKDGLYQRPAGRKRKGMDWDAVRGRWIPSENPSDDD